MTKEEAINILEHKLKEPTTDLPHDCAEAVSIAVVALKHECEREHQKSVIDNFLEIGKRFN